MVTKAKIVIIGGGFFGLSIALFLRDEMGEKDILVLEKEPDLMNRASYVNQARVHMGYHYPRSILTGSRSAHNFDRFVNDYREAVVSNFNKYYAISSQLSKVNAKQFENFCRKIHAPFQEVDKSVGDLFSPALVERAYQVKEYAFDSRVLRDILLRQVHSEPGIKILTGEKVRRISTAEPEGLRIVTSAKTILAQNVYNCAYSSINWIHRQSDLPLLPLKHELAEMCLVRLPKALQDFSVTLMDGPFFSIMPFPSKGLHTLSHVRYTPHTSWLDDDTVDRDKQEPHEFLKETNIQSAFKKMHADVQRYLPVLESMEYVESIREVKTVLTKSEGDDSRPILFKPDYSLKGYTCIMGGKLDNIYDIFEELREYYEKNEA